MAGRRTSFGFIDYHDGEGKAVVNGREMRWEFHEFCGPFFLKKNGDPLKKQPGERHAVWKYFEKWLRKYKAARAKAKASTIVRV